jgi:hypothetical protein
VILFSAFIIWTLRSALYEPVVAGQPAPADAKELPKSQSKTTNNTESTNHLMEVESELEEIVEIGAII